MPFFHIHRWTEYARTYASGTTHMRAEYEMEPKALARIFMGATTFLFRCEALRWGKPCGELRDVICVGKVVSPTDGKG
jgi:hypothetical protein